MLVCRYTVFNLKNKNDSQFRFSPPIQAYKMHYLNIEIFEKVKIHEVISLKKKKKKLSLPGFNFKINRIDFIYAFSVKTA